jgi:hypothetical protein
MQNCPYYKLVKHHVMKTYGRVEGYLLCFWPWPRCRLIVSFAPRPL